MRKFIFKILLAGLPLLLLITGYFLSIEWREQEKANEQAAAKPVPKYVQDGYPLMDFTDFTKLKAKYPDIVAWLTIDGTSVDYPVVQTADNGYYLDHSADQKQAKLGALFLDYRISPDFTDFNNIIYGHNTKSGKMFGQLVRFKGKEFFEKNKNGWLYTPGKTYKLEIFAVSVTDSMSGYYQFAFLSSAEKTAHVDMILQNAIYFRETQIGEDDRIVALSTCSYEFEDSRTVVHAVLR